ncbi:MAG: response regulator [Blastocatellia bacterium]
MPNTRKNLAALFGGAAASPSQHAASSESKPKRKAALRVFLVDDSPLVTERMMALLTTIEKVQIVGTARTAGAAIRGIQHLTPDLVILDFQLLDGTGVDVLKAIRRGPHTPVVIMLTNFAYEQYRVECLQWGADYFFDKSQDFERVLETCRQLLAVPEIAYGDCRNVSEPSFSPHKKMLPLSVFPRQVLIVAEEETYRGLTASLLEQKDCRVRTVANGYAALGALAQDAVDLILMDLQSPATDGLAAAQALRQQEQQIGSHVPIIALTNETSVEKIHRYWQAGIDGYIAKPIQIETFYRTIEAVMMLQTRLICELDAWPIFDRAAALARVNNSPELLRGVAEMFFSTSQHLLAALRRAASKNDASNLDFAAHRLKGAACNLAACRVVELAERLELMGGIRNLSRAQETVALLETELERFAATYATTA